MFPVHACIGSWSAGQLETPCRQAYGARILAAIAGCVRTSCRYLARVSIDAAQLGRLALGARITTAWRKPGPRTAAAQRAVRPSARSLRCKPSSRPPQQHAWADWREQARGARVRGLPSVHVVRRLRSWRKALARRDRHRTRLLATLEPRSRAAAAGRWSRPARQHRPRPRLKGRGKEERGRSRNLQQLPAPEGGPQRCPDSRHQYVHPNGAE